MSRKEKDMQVIILAGGKGTRLKPYTTVLPKPLMPVVDIPILEVIIKQLRHFGFREIIFSVGYLSELIEAYCGDGRRWGVKATYVRETKPLGTIAPLRLIKNIKKTILVMNGDVLTDLDFHKFIEYHHEHKGIATIATYPKKVKINLGVIESDADKKIIGFVEKPTYQHFVSMGIYLFEKQISRYIPKKLPFGFDELMHSLIEHKKSIYSYLHQGYWLDLGNYEDYERAQKEFIHKREKFLYEKRK